MLASVLSSPVAIQASIQVVRAFVHLGQILLTHRELAEKLAALETKIESHSAQFKAVFDAIRKLMLPPLSTGRQIGFRTEERKDAMRTKAAANWGV